MKITLALLTLCALLGGTLAIAQPEPLAAGSPATHRQATVEHVTMGKIPLADYAQDRLAAHVLSVIESWPKAQTEMADLGDVANDIAFTAIHDDPAWIDDVYRDQTAMLLASLAFYEGVHFAAYVDDGRCQAWGKLIALHLPMPAEGAKYMHYGTCDHGAAQSLWQVHSVTLQNPTEVATSENLLDRRFAAHIALRLARQSLNATSTLRYYTGEWSGPCPKADERLSFAIREIDAHPYR